MKNKIILIIISFFSFITIASATVNIDDININIKINEDGSALIVENWTISDATIKYIDKVFLDVNRNNISDLKVNNEDCSTFTEVKTLGKKECEYQFLKDKLTIYSKNPGVYSISYKINKFITQFKDVDGVNYYLFAGDNQTVSSFSTVIINAYGYNSDNSSLYLITDSDVKADYIENHVEIIGNNINKNSKIRFMSSLANMEFTNKLVNDEKFMDVYRDAMNNHLLVEKISSFVKSRIFIIVVSSVLLIIIYFILNKVMGKGSKDNDYYGILPYNKVTKFKLEDVKYYDNIPCNGDLYRIFFIAGYYGLIKNKSDLIGAIMLSWDFEGYLKIKYDSENSSITLFQGAGFNRSLDEDLYGMLKDASNELTIESTRLIKYANMHYLRVMTWYNMGFNETINSLLNSGDIKRSDHLKKVTLHVQEGMYNDAVLIAGLKKYLINFNQVPRQTPLNATTYKYLLIIAELLGIGKQVAEEILRKNPDNVMATELLNLENSKYLYKKIYETAYGPYKEVVKNKRVKRNYDPEMERLLKQREPEEERHSKI